MYIYTHIHTYIHIYIYDDVFPLSDGSRPVNVRVCVWICVYVCAYINTHTRTQIHVYTYTLQNAEDVRGEVSVQRQIMSYHRVCLICFHVHAYV